MILSCLCGKLKLEPEAGLLSMLAHDWANAIIISDVIDLFVKSTSCLAGVFIYHKIDLFLQGFFFSNIHSWRSLSGVQAGNTLYRGHRTQRSGVECHPWATECCVSHR